MPVLRQFFAEFQNLVHGSLARIRALAPLPGESAPELRVWKANGDELLLECRVTRLAQVVLAERAFRRAVREFNRSVSESTNRDSRPVRGTGWAAGFPLRNRRLFFDLEGAEERPDFIGPQIDLGFRLTKFDGHHPDWIVLAPELAWLLARASQTAWFSGDLPLLYRGRHVFKGIAGGVPVPVFCTDTLDKADLTTEDRLWGTLERPRCPIDNARETLRAFLMSNTEWAQLPFIVDDPDLGPTASALAELERKRTELRNKASVDQYGDEAMGTPEDRMEAPQTDDPP